MWFSSNLAYVHGERSWDCFINKLGTRDLNILFDSHKNIHLLVESHYIIRVYFFSMHRYLPIFFLISSSLFVLQCTTRLQSIFKDYEMILAVGWLKNLINPCRSWFPWSLPSFPLKLQIELSFLSSACISLNTSLLSGLRCLFG